MAQKISVELVDDLDGTSSSDVSTVSFGLDGASYEIDLTETNAKALRTGLERFIEVGRRTGGRSRRISDAPRPTVDPEQNRAIRDWARKNGHDVSDRGRLPATIIKAFNSAR